jgi:diacylglycerol kinase family enzyme
MPSRPSHMRALLERLATRLPPGVRGAVAAEAGLGGRRPAAGGEPGNELRSFRRPVVLLNPRSGGVQAARGRLEEAAAHHGVELREAPPAGLAAAARQAVADGADALGVAGGDGSLAAVAGVAIETGLPFVCVPAGTRNHFARDLGLDRSDPAAALEAFVAGPERRVDVATVGDRPFLNNVSIGVYAALVHQPSYRDDRLGAVDGLLQGMLDDDTLPIPVRFQDGYGRAWEQALVLLVSNNAYPLAGFGARPRLDAGVLEVSALRRTDGQQAGRTAELLAGSRRQAGDGWARWITTAFEVDSPAGRLQAGVDGEPVVLEAPLRFRIRAAALRVLLPPPRPERQDAERRQRPYPDVPLWRLLDLAATRPPGEAAEGRPAAPQLPSPEQLTRMVRLWRLLDQVGHRMFGPGQPEAPPRQQGWRARRRRRRAGG